MSGSVAQSRRLAANPSPLACVECRSKHLKCDADQPVCTRCRLHRLKCVYVKSRRGQRLPKSRVGESTLEAGGIVAQPVESGSDSGLGQSLSADSRTGSPHSTASLNYLPTSDVRSNGAAVPALGPSLASSGTESTPHLPHQTRRWDDEVQFHRPSQSQARVVPDSNGDSNFLTNLFYLHVHPAHPFIIPQTFFRPNPGFIPGYLLSAMQFAGANFVDGFDDRNLRASAVQILTEQSPSDGTNVGFKVQALLLLAIVLHARHEESEGFVALEKAVDLGLELGIQDPVFARLHSNGNLIVEESWRRTWWELYTVDTMFSILSPTPRPPRLRNIQSNMPLPCEESEYTDCRLVFPTKCWAEFETRAFFEDTHEYSSFAYKIEAIRLMGLVQSLGLSPFEAADDQTDAIDTSLSNFFLSLPPRKRELVEIDGKVDEVLFSAHMIVNAATVLYHRPRSTLPLFKQYYTACTKGETRRVPLAPAKMSHTIKALRAANNLSAAAALQVPLTKHSPCFTCSIAMATIVHLPAYMMSASGVSTGDFNTHAIKERLQLSLNALNTVGEVWEMAKVVRTQLSAFARETLFFNTYNNQDSTSSNKVDSSAQVHPQATMVPQMMPTSTYVASDESPDALSWFDPSFDFLNGVGTGHAAVLAPWLPYGMLE